MDNIEKTKEVLLVLIGDIHGDFEKLIRMISKYDLRDCVCIQVGDFGIGFKPLKKDLATMKYLNKFLNQRNIVFYAVRGNHDCPEFFKGAHVFSNLILLKDYSTIILGDGRKILCIGGAISIDRMPNLMIKDAYGKSWEGRREGVDYWKDEAFVLDEEKIKTMRDIDIVITHSAPNFAFPIGVKGMDSGWINNDPTLYKELMDERDNLAKMYDILKKNGNGVKIFAYGHFHHSNKEERDGTIFKLLDIDEFYEVR